MLNFSAVLPLPNTSYATPNRGVRSLYAFTPSVRGNVIGAALNFETTLVPSPSAGLKLHARSYRRAACTVSRLCVQVSWMNADCVSVRSAVCHIGSLKVNRFAKSGWVAELWNRYASRESLVTILV